MKYKMKLTRWMVVAALLNAPTGYLLAQDQSDELKRLKQQLQELDQKVRILERSKELEAEAADAKAKTLPTVNLGAGGLSVSTGDSNFTFKIRGYVQADSRTFLGDDEAVKGNETFLFRRVRPIIEGAVWKDFEYRLMMDFASGITSGTGNNAFLQDGYVNFHHWDEVQLQVGKFKEPVGLERLQSGGNLLFVERSLPTQLAPNRDVGVQLHGKLWGNTLAYQVGYFNGVEDGGSGDIETTDDGKDVAARIFAQPFDRTSIEPLKKFGLGVAVTHGTHVGALRNYTTSGQQTWFRWRTGAGTAAAPNVMADGTTDRFAPQAYYYWGPFGVFGEYTIASHEVAIRAGAAPGQTRHETFHNRAWQVSASYFLTGEENSFAPVAPKRPFGFGPGSGWGAWEIVARVGQLTIDDGVFRDRDAIAGPDFATANSAREVREWAVGLNWYLNRNIKANVNYLHADFKGGSKAKGEVTAQDEEAIFARVQFNF
jgi:phosphate-selective porin OprO/OprP